MQLLQGLEMSQLYYFVLPNVRVPKDSDWLNHRIVEILSELDGFRTIEQYATAVTGNLRSEEALEVSNFLTTSNTFENWSKIPENTVLESVLADYLRRKAASGWFLSWNNFFSEVQKKNISVGKIEAIGIITSNRPYALERCLESYIKNCLKFGRGDTSFFIADDSTCKTSLIKNYEISVNMRRKYNVNISYLNSEIKENWIGSIHTVGSEAESLRFLTRSEFPGQSCGANRNSLVLATAGKRVLFVDDDTTADVYRHPDSNDDLSFLGQGKIQTVKSFSSKENAKDSLVLVEECVLNAHEKILGHDAASICRNFYSKNSSLSNVENFSRGLFHSVKHEKGHVYATLVGILGDSGANITPDNALAVILRNRGLGVPDSESNLGRIITKYSNRFEIRQRGPFMSTFFGLDNRIAHVPFFPYFRMEDTLFGAMNSAVSQDKFVGYIPRQLEHTPIEERADPLLGPINLSSNAMVSNCSLLQLATEILSNKLRGCAKVYSLGDAGKHFESILAEGFYDLAEEMRLRAQESIVYKIGLMENQHDLDSETKKLVDQCLKGLYLQRDNPVIFSDRFFYNGSIKDADAKVKSLAIKFAQAIQSWSSLHAKFVQMNTEKMHSVA
jgi:hypothetical protein